MAFKWQDKHMELFIETYQQKECLWNTKSSDYSKSYLREKAYSSMLNDLNLPGLTVADIKSKIKTIRTRYAAELHKVRNSEKSGAGVDEIYEPRLFWFKLADAFLRNVCTLKASSSNLEDFESTGTDTTEKSINGRQHLEQCTQHTSDVQDTEMASPDNTEKPLAVSPTTGTSIDKLRNCKRGQKRSLNTTVAGVHSAIKQLKQLSEENKQDPNEFDVFCESLAIQLKKMPLNRALLCQEKLQNVMTQERLSQLTSHSHSHRSKSFNSSDYPQSPATYNSRQSSPNHSIHSQESQNFYYPSTRRDERYEDTQSHSNIVLQALSPGETINGALICLEKPQNVTIQRLTQLTSHSQSQRTMSYDSPDYLQSLATLNTGQYSAMSSQDHSIHSQQLQNFHYPSTGRGERYEDSHNNILPQALSAAGISDDLTLL